MIKDDGGAVKLKKKLDRLTEPERRLVLAFIRGIEDERCRWQMKRVGDSVSKGVCQTEVQADDHCEQRNGNGEQQRACDRAGVYTGSAGGNGPQSAERKRRRR